MRTRLPVRPKKHHLVQYSDALAGRKKVEKSAKPKATAIKYTEEMLVGMLEHGVVLDGFSSGVIKQLVLAWDAAGMIESRRGQEIVKKLKTNKSTKRKPTIKKRSKNGNSTTTSSTRRAGKAKVK